MEHIIITTAGLEWKAEWGKGILPCYSLDGLMDKSGCKMSIPLVDIKPSMFYTVKDSKGKVLYYGEDVKIANTTMNFHNRNRGKKKLATTTSQLTLREGDFQIANLPKQNIQAIYRRKDTTNNCLLFVDSLGGKLLQGRTDASIIKYWVDDSKSISVAIVELKPGKSIAFITKASQIDYIDEYIWNGERIIEKMTEIDKSKTNRIPRILTS